MNLRDAKGDVHILFGAKYKRLKCMYLLKREIERNIFKMVLEIKS